MKRLVVNADDLGADPGRNRGIAEAAAAGVVTSVSVLANGPALEDAVARLRPLVAAGVSAGAHLNLSEGRPLAPGHRLLTGPDGDFRGKAGAQGLLDCPEATLAEEILAEFEAQVGALAAAGLPLTHLDGHQHVHVFPAAVEAAAEMARRHRIPWVRVPDELPPPGPDPSSVSAGFARRARDARGRLTGDGVRAPDHFRGLYLVGRLTSRVLAEVAAGLRPGLTEFMVHPGRCDPAGAGGPFGRFATADREAELDALLDLRFRRALVEAGVALTPFPGVGS